VEVYERNGRILPPTKIDQREDWAGRYLVAPARSITPPTKPAQAADRRQLGAARSAQIDTAGPSGAQQHRLNYDDWRTYPDDTRSGAILIGRLSANIRQRSAEALTAEATAADEGPHADG